MNKIKIGIVGYGNLGKGAEKAVKACEDMELVGIFTRRDPKTLKLDSQGVKAYLIEDAFTKKDEIDVMILCGGSATDLPVQGPQLAEYFNTIDSFDTHAKIPEYFESIDKAAKASNHTSIISVGWDPGLFSINRVYAQSIMPTAQSYTFWGKGVSQGHSDAIRRIQGVKDAKQYTIPITAAMDEVRNGTNPQLTARQKHLRECFVVAYENADLEKIAQQIKEMPNYFADYDTTVHFVCEEEFSRDHSKMPHGGFVIASEKNEEIVSTIEYSLKLDSNPLFTSKVLVAYARAAYKLSCENNFGAKTVLDVAPSYISPLSSQTLRATAL
ncbi:MAG: diaminopimelate dehydrogenase [Oscillospiraceae bacterium]